VRGLIADAEPERYRDTIIFPASLDPDASKIIRRLKKFGHSAYLVGGCVRDLLLGSIPKDFDVATSARPRQIRRLFKNSKVIGRRFKLVHVMFGDKIIEVSTYRKSPEQSNNFFKSDGLLIVRDNVYGDERDDALRRDFTVNSLFYDLENEEVVDYAQGVKDIQRRVLRTIGPPDIRFQEDPVRILRAIRFSCRLKLDIQEDSLESMRTYAGNISMSAAQRVTEEIIRLMACGASARALDMMINLGVCKVLLPEAFEAFEKKADYFDLDLNGRELLLGLADAMDRTDRGKRRFNNPVFLSLLFSHLGGSAIHEAREAKHNRHVDPGAVLNTALRPLFIRMGISRWELSRVKQILISFNKLNASSKRRRYKTRDFILRDYFRDALEFYRQVMVVSGRGLERYQWWQERLDTALKEGASPRAPSRKRRRKPRKKRPFNRDSRIRKTS
jgi:poly(A) polymerase